MPHRRTVRIAATVASAVALVAGLPTAHGTGYDDPDYAAFDVDNMARSTQRQVDQLTDPEHHLGLLSTGTESHTENQLDQVRELRNGRLYVGLGQIIPGGSVGDPTAYHEVATTEVNFLFRSGAKLEGHLFAPVGTDGPVPGVVITTGSIQGTQHMYWWAARSLARNGYLVMTWDVQGQGESESTPHAPGQRVPFADPADDDGLTTDGVPFQQPYNFHEGTVDALRFFTSTPADPYVPGGWTTEDLGAALATHDAGSEPIDWVNPLAGLFDGEHLGIAGHSLGAGAVSHVQECSDRAQRWREIVGFCTRSFPIDAVVGWDRLGTDGGADPYVPVVPGMDQQADGYFLNTSPTFEAPGRREQRSRVDGGAFEAWRGAGLDTYTLTIRGGLHSEWTEVPYILSATSYGVAMADFYTLAWMDRFVHPDPTRQADALRRLLTGPVPTGSELAAGVVPPWRANLMSARYAGGFSLHEVGDGAAVHHRTEDLRAYAGLSPVGDWAGANADRPAVAGDGGGTLGG